MSSRTTPPRTKMVESSFALFDRLGAPRGRLERSFFTPLRRSAGPMRVECTTRNVVGQPVQVRLQLLGPDLRTAMDTAYASVGPPLRESPWSPMYLCEPIQTFVEPPMACWKVWFTR